MPARRYFYNIYYDQVDICTSIDSRSNLKKKGLDSLYADALGYYPSQKMSMTFLTGDKVFKELGVEYVM